MSNTYHSTSFYAAYDSDRHERDNAKAKRRGRKQRRRAERRQRNAAERHGEEAYGPCTRKRAFASRQHALSYMAWHPQYGRQSAYRCPYCGLWHLTTKPWLYVDEVDEHNI